MYGPVIECIGLRSGIGISLEKGPCIHKDARLTRDRVQHIPAFVPDPAHTFFPYV